MELSEEVKQSYLDFCGIYQNPNNENDKRIITVSYNPDEDKVTVTEKGIYYEQQDVESTKQMYEFSDNKYQFERLDSTTISFTEIKNGYYRNGHGDVGDSYSDYGKGDNSYEYYLDPKTTCITNTTYYIVPENFKLEDGLDLTKMEEIKENKSSKTR